MNAFKTNKIQFVTIVLLLGLLLGFQNCGSSKNFTTKTQTLSGSSDNSGNANNDGSTDGDDGDDSSTPPEENLACFFDGEEIADGSSVIAYQNSSVPNGSLCVAERRTCLHGNLSGSYNFVNCQVNSPAACLFNGRMIASGETVDAFLNSSPAAGDSCQKEVRACENGLLSGNYNFSSCMATPFANCEFNGRTVMHNESIKAFQNSSVAAGSTCQEQMRVCKNGVLSGAYNFASCTVNAPASCMFNGQTLAHGQSVSAYQNSTVPAGQSCVWETRTCNDGVLSGSFNIGSCKPDAFASCMFNGKTIAHGQNVKAYSSSSVSYGQACTSSVRSCNNGQLTGSGEFASCAVEAAKSCNVNGTNYAHGQTVTMFASSSVPYGESCMSQARTCTNGVMSGTAQFSSCAVNTPASCLLGTQTIAHGQTVTAYSASSVPNGQVCSAVSQARTCSNGSLSGSASYSFSDCSVVGLVSSGVTVTINCSISAGNNQSLVLILADGTQRRWDFGNGTRSIAAFTAKFDSAPTQFKAYSGSAQSAHRYSNQTARTINFSSEDGTDNDYNDLVCSFSW